MKLAQFSAPSSRPLARATAIERPRPARRRQFVPAPDRLEDRRLLTATMFAEGFGGGAGKTVTVEAEAVDSMGNVYIAGGFSGTVSFGSTTLTSAGLENIFVAKLDTAGNVTWAKRMGSAATTQGDYGRGLALDSNGNIFVTGWFAGNATFGGVSLTDAGGRDIFVEKLDNSGNVLWAKGFGGPGDDLGQSLAVDAGGNVVVTGSYQKSVVFGATTLTAADSSASDVFVTKLNTSGTVQWATSLAGSGGNSGFGIATDSSNNVFVTGNLSGTGSFGGITLTSAGDTDIFVTKLSSSGTVNWAFREGGTGHDDGIAITVDPSGDIYATGDFVGSATFGNSTTLTSAGQDDAYVEKINTSGGVVWADDLGGTGFDAGFGIAANAQGTVYATGVFQGTAHFGNSTLTSVGGYDVYMAKITLTGTVIEAFDFGSTGSDQSYQVALGSVNNTFTVVGDYGAGFNVNNDGLASSGSGFVIQLSETPPASGSEALSNFDGVGHSQIAVFRPSTTQWFALGLHGGHLVGSFGAKTDIPVAGDYDSLGHSELAVYRPSTSQWFALGPNGGHMVGTFGGPNDIPAPGDYNNVGHTELAVYRPSTGQWFALGPNGGHVVGTYGGPHDIPVPGDYDALGHTELAVYRPSTGQWFVLGPNGGHVIAIFGAPGDIPVPGDYDGVGHAEPAVFRPSTGQWFVDGPNGGHLMNVFGAPNLSDIPTETAWSAYRTHSSGVGGSGGSGGGITEFAVASGPGGALAPSSPALSGAGLASRASAAQSAPAVITPSLTVRQANPPVNTDPVSLSIEQLYG